MNVDGEEESVEYWKNLLINAKCTVTRLDKEDLSSQEESLLATLVQESSFLTNELSSTQSPIPLLNSPNDKIDYIINHVSASSIQLQEKITQYQKEIQDNSSTMKLLQSKQTHLESLSFTEKQEHVEGLQKQIQSLESVNLSISSKLELMIKKLMEVTSKKRKEKLDKLHQNKIGVSSSTFSSLQQRILELHDSYLPTSLESLLPPEILSQRKKILQGISHQDWTLEDVANTSLHIKNSLSPLYDNTTQKYLLRESIDRSPVIRSTFDYTYFDKIFLLDRDLPEAGDLKSGGAGEYEELRKRMSLSKKEGRAWRELMGKDATETVMDTCGEDICTAISAYMKKRDGKIEKRMEEVHSWEWSLREIENQIFSASQKLIYLNEFDEFFDCVTLPHGRVTVDLLSDDVNLNQYYPKKNMMAEVNFHDTLREALRWKLNEAAEAMTSFYEHAGLKMEEEEDQVGGRDKGEEDGRLRSTGFGNEEKRKLSMKGEYNRESVIRGITQRENDILRELYQCGTGESLIHDTLSILATRAEIEQELQDFSLVSIFEDYDKVVAEFSLKRVFDEISTLDSLGMVIEKETVSIENEKKHLEHSISLLRQLDSSLATRAIELEKDYGQNEDLLRVEKMVLSELQIT